MTKTWIPLITMTTILLLSTPSLPAGEPLVTETLTFTGTNVQVAEGTGPTPVPLHAPCDEDGLGAVRFCETLLADTLPDQVAIDLREAWGMRAGGVWEFRDASGTVTSSGTFCGFVNTFVPHAENGGFPDPVELVIYPAIHVLPEDVSDYACGSPGTHGDATVVWRYDAPVFS